MQSRMAVAGMDAFELSLRKHLTRRANQWHYSTIAQFAKRPWPCPTHGPARQRAPLARLQAKNPYPQLKLHRLVKLQRLVERLPAPPLFLAPPPRRAPPPLSRAPPPSRAGPRRAIRQHHT